MAKIIAKSGVYSLIALQLVSYELDISAGINYEVRDRRDRTPFSRVYNFDSRVRLYCTCIDPDGSGKVGDEYSFAVLTGDSRAESLSRILKDYKAVDDSGTPVSRRVRGRDEPVYNEPKGVGFIENYNRHTDARPAYLWLPPETISDMLAVLTTMDKLFVTVHQYKFERKRWIVGFTLQTTNPLDE